MRNVMERTEEDKRVASLRPDKQQKPGAVLLLKDIAAACRRVLASGALRLPMEPTRTHGKVLVTGGRRECLLGLVQGHKEDLRVDRLNPKAASLGVARPDLFRHAQSDQDLVPHVLPMEEQRAITQGRGLLRVQSDPIQQHFTKFLQLLS